MNRQTILCILAIVALLALALLSVNFPALADALTQGEGWSLGEMQHIFETIGDQSTFFQGAVLAPDGSAIAWPERDEALCVYTHAEESVDCYPLADEDFRGRVTSLTWSPDSAYLAFTENLLELLYEPDLWLLDVATGTFTNRTDDGVAGGFLSEGRCYWLDYVPTWDPASGDLYFFRSEPSEEGEYTLALYRLPIVADSEPQLVRDLTDDLPQPFPIYRSAAISPDGAQVAMIVLSRQKDDPRDGIWLLDLTGDSLERVATLDDLRTGLPEWDNTSEYLPEGLAWAAGTPVGGTGDSPASGHGIGLVVGTANRVAALLGSNCYYIDLSTGEAAPLVDLSDIPAPVPEGALFEVGDDGHTAVYRVPRVGVISPDGGTFFYLHREQRVERAGISALPLPPDGSAPVLLGEIDHHPVIGVAPPLVLTASADGRALLDCYYLVTFEAQ